MQPTELLAERGDIHRWLASIDLPVPGVTIDDLEATREPWETIDRAATSVIEGRRIHAADVALLNRIAVVRSISPRLRAVGSVAWAARDHVEVADALRTLARDAIELVAADDG